MAPKAALPARRSGRISSTLNVGTKVEVRSDETGFEDAWFEATITTVLPGLRGYEVEYLTFKTDQKRPQPLRETVLVPHVRPAASLPRGACHEPDQLVDACWNDAWWRGAVAGVSGDPPAAYVVAFPISRVELKFNPRDVRAHQEWANGLWFPSRLEGALYKEEDRVEVSGDKESYGVVWHPARVTKVIDKTTFVVVYETEENTQREFLDVQYIRPLPSPTPADKAFELLEPVEVYYRCGWRLGRVSKIIDDSNYIVKLKSGQEVEIACDLMRIDCKWINGRWTCNTEVSGRSFGSGSNRKRGDGPSSEGRGQKNRDASEKLKSKVDPKTPSMETQFHDVMSDHEFDFEISKPTLVKIPFTTKSDFWVSDEFIQCCRVLPQPQEPNFDKILEITNKETVEDMAISQVKHFAQLVTDIKNLHILDKEEPFEDILEILVELEKYRYNVRCVRLHIEELLRIRNDHRQLHRKKTKLQKMVIETYSEYQTLDKTIKEMEKNLADLRRKRTTTRSDLAKLKNDVQATNEAESSAHKRFDTVHSSRV